MSPLTTHFLYAPYEEPPGCARLIPLYMIPRKYSYSMSPLGEAFNFAMLAGNGLQKPIRKKASAAAQVFTAIINGTQSHFVSFQAQRSLLTQKTAASTRWTKAISRNKSCAMHPPISKIVDLNLVCNIFNKQYTQKNRRFADYSQVDVARSIAGVLSSDISQTTISRYETFTLSTRNMRKIKPMLDAWLDKVNEATSSGITAADFLRQSRVCVYKQTEQPAGDGRFAGGGGGESGDNREHADGRIGNAKLKRHRRRLFYFRRQAGRRPSVHRPPPPRAHNADRRAARDAPRDVYTREHAERRESAQAERGNEARDSRLFAIFFRL